MAKKTLILYYSWSGNTKKIAEKIKYEIPDSDLQEVTVADGTFDSDQYKTNDIALDQIQGTKEFPEAQMPTIDFNDYDLVLVGSPVWSGYPATPIKSLLEKMKDYKGEVASFFTSAGTNHKAYISHFKEWAAGLNVIGVARDDSEVQTWIK
ncbi:flavodoxin family protein [Lactobacillus ultunensis]|uniref:Flavodoxin-like domain-containing protein n=1 Tax=Lactobacillus ultunensis DSM 16047 TaxID=525365 RepID=C2EMY4_9LACO|nr:flavodoxin [Lactobacillus ultunensis]EEJ72112.1 hypothetical protein HMPREF0548_1044 [Lactobacillus ultunensis DSM 16047]KRL80843.1 flavodoxin [Lactobacillus ultunensis DSM 16047]QQP27717.1 transcriptional regulator [Lactobacillus ultunensis]